MLELYPGKKYFYVVARLSKKKNPRWDTTLQDGYTKTKIHWMKQWWACCSPPCLFWLSSSKQRKLHQGQKRASSFQTVSAFYKLVTCKYNNIPPKICTCLNWYFLWLWPQQESWINWWPHCSVPNEQSVHLHPCFAFYSYSYLLFLSLILLLSFNKCPLQRCL